jgi:hypothetical protein
MRTILLLLLITFICSGSGLAQRVGELQRFTYNLSGKVTDNKSIPLSQMFVCWDVAPERPLTGRIPCTQTDQGGEYALTVHGIPDKYIVWASNCLSMITDPKRCRWKSSEVLEFGAHDETRRIDLQFAATKKQLRPIKIK